MQQVDIEQIPLFNLLPRTEVEYLKSILIPREIEANHLMFKEGEAGDRLSVILQGQVEVIKAINTKDEWIVAVLGPGDFFGEMSLLYPDRQRSASVRALTNVRFLDLTQQDFYALLQRQPDVGFHIMQEMSLRLRNSEDATIRDLTTKNTQLSRALDELKAAQQQLIEKGRLEHELVMARKIQESILPRHIPEFSGWEIAAHWQPARSVSGDFYDFIPLPGNRLCLIIGDVSDKGIPAALVMATTRSLLRYAALSESERGDVSPAVVLARVNDALCDELPILMFVTCLFAVLEPETGRMTFANAGQSLPYWCDGPSVQKLNATGMPLGLMPGMSYDDKEIILQPGQRVFLFSDGLIEAHNAQGEMFGLPRLSQHLTNAQPRTLERKAGELINHLTSSLNEFTGSEREPEDDVTIVVLDRLTDV